MDVASLVTALPMGGPKTADLNILLAKSPDDYEEIASLQTISIERQAFWDAFHQTVEEFETKMTRK